MIDTRLIGTTAEYILTCLLRNTFKIFTQRFDVEGFDIIVFDYEHKLFKENSPIFIQVRTRSDEKPTGISLKKYKAVTRLAKRLSIPTESVYFAFGAFANDIRTVRFFLIRWDEIPKLCGSEGSFRFKPEELEKQVKAGTIRGL